MDPGKTDQNRDIAESRIERQLNETALVTQWVSVGAALWPSTLEDAASRLKDSGRFAAAAPGAGDILPPSCPTR